MFLLGPTIFIRVPIIILLLFMVAMHGFAATLFFDDMNLPLPAHRRAIVTSSRHYVRIILLLLGYITLDVRGYRENCTRDMHKGQKRIVYVFNHVSFVDSMLMLYFFQPCGVTKKSIARIPILGTAIRGFQNVLVERVEAGSEGANLVNVGAKASNKTKLIAERVDDKRYPNMAVAPEGTTTNGRTVVKFKRGAFVPGAPVLPIVIRYPCRHHNVAWTLRDDLFALVRMMCQFRNYVSVTVLPEYAPSAAERDDAELYANNVQRLFASELGAEPSNQDLATQFRLMQKGVKVSWDGRTILAPSDMKEHGYLVGSSEA